MTDEEFLFRQDVAEKKRTATGAHHKITHGGRVMMPSDYLTKKEREAMNSAVTTYKLGEPCTWEEFLRMPTETKKEYLLTLYDKYNPSFSMLSQMFGKTPSAISIAFKSWKMPKSGCTRKRTPEEIAAWGQFLDILPQGHPDPVGEPGEPGVTGVPDVIEVHKISPVDPKTGTVAFDGNVEDVLIAIRRMFAGNPNLRMRVTWEAMDD